MNTADVLVEREVLPSSRVESIDLLRGLVMIIMALDHVRSYFHLEAFVFSPTDLRFTYPALFATRLVTHLCAPIFILLAGASIYFIAQRKTLKATRFFLVTRGSWLILLQVTIVQFGWNFDPAFHFRSSNIISTIGLCMIALSFLIHLPFRYILLTGLLTVLLHNLLDNISFPPQTFMEVVWNFLHGRKTYELANGYSFQFIYPLIPWVGVMALGYCLGRIYDSSYSSQKRIMITGQIGIACLSTFILLRALNIYGNPTPWTLYPDVSTTVMSFFNVEKYPPSLQFLCLTLGAAMIFLSFTEGRRLEGWASLSVFGKVPLFYYVLHIYVIHALAMLAVAQLGYPWQEMVFLKVHNEASDVIKGKFGFSLTYTYLIWGIVVALLYVPCLYWYSFKLRNKNKWWASFV